jgi:uncharacterized protein YegL
MAFIKGIADQDRIELLQSHHRWLGAHISVPRLTMPTTMRHQPPQAACGTRTPARASTPRHYHQAQHQQTVVSQHYYAVQFIIDTSTSMNDGKLEAAKRAMTSVVTQSVLAQEPNFHFRLVSFNTVVNEIVPWRSFKKNSEQIMAGIGSLCASGGTALFNAIGQSMQGVTEQLSYMQAHSPGRQRFIFYTFVLTDGEDTEVAASARNDCAQQLNQQLAHPGVPDFHMVIVNAQRGIPNQSLHDIAHGLNHVNIVDLSAAADTIRTELDTIIRTTLQKIVRMVTIPVTTYERVAQTVRTPFAMAMPFATTSVRARTPARASTPRSGTRVQHQVPQCRFGGACIFFKSNRCDKGGQEAHLL